MSAPKKTALATPKLTARELAGLDAAIDRCVLRQHLVPFHEALKEMNRNLDKILAKVDSNYAAKSSRYAKPKPRKRPKKGAKPNPDRGAALTKE